MKGRAPNPRSSPEGDAAERTARPGADTERSGKPGSPNPIWTRLAAGAGATAPVRRRVASSAGAPDGPDLPAGVVVGPENDRYEREADRVADRVMRTPVPGGVAVSRAPPRVQRACAECSRTGETCAECEDERPSAGQAGGASAAGSDGVIRRQPATSRGSAGTAGSAAPAANDPRGGRALPDPGLRGAGPGRPLDPASRAFFEPRFGLDFGDVRIHSNGRAARLAESVGARAFALGPNIVFGDGEHSPRSRTGRRLLAHELTHVAQQKRGAAVRLRRTPLDELTRLSIGESYADDWTTEQLEEAVRHLRRRAAASAPGTLEHETASENLEVLEREVATRPLGESDAGAAAAGEAGTSDLLYTPGPQMSAAPPADTGSTDLLYTPDPQMSVPPPTAAPPVEDVGICLPDDALESQSALEESLQQCVDTSALTPEQAPIVAEGLGRAALMADYRSKARELLLFRLDAMLQWIDIVVREQVTGPEGEGSEEMAETLRDAAVEANRLAEVAWERKTLLSFHDELIDRWVPPEGSPVPALAGLTTLGSEEYIREVFSREALRERHFPEEFPDVLGMLDRLGLPPAVTEEEVTDHVIRNANDADLYRVGFEQLRREGKLIWWGRHVDPPIEWTEREYSEEEIRQVGLDHIHEDPASRQTARMLLEADPTRRGDPDEEAVLDIGSTAPAYNYRALRFVVQRLRAAAALRLQFAQNELNNHFDRHPLLRLYVSDWATVKNLLRAELILAGDFEDVIDPADIRAENLLEKLEELLDDLRELRDDVDSDDDFLFDSAVASSLEPLIRRYAEVDPTYAEWIRDRFEENRRWEERIDTLLLAGGLLGTLLAGVLTGGWGFAAGVAAVGFFGGMAVRSQQRAETLEQAAHAGIASFDEAAVARFQAWLDTAVAALTAVSTFARPLVALVQDIRAAIQTGRAATPTIRAVTLATKNLSAAEAAQVREWTRQLQRIVSEAVELVDSGGGASRWAQIHRGSGALGGTPLARGNAIHSEAFRMIRSRWGRGVLTNRGAAFRRQGFPNRFGRDRPDIRFSLDGGREAIFDITTLAQMGHSAQYAERAWVEVLIELLY